MSVYTTTLQAYCESIAGLTAHTGHKDTNTTIKDAMQSIFDFEYPIFDDTYRQTLELKIIRHYYYREVGFETVGMFKDRLQTKLNEIMPYYNELYTTIIKEFNPKYDTDYHREGTRVDDGTESNTGTVTNDGESYAERTPDLVSTTKVSDTPQGGVTGLDTDTYMSQYNKATSSGTDSTTGTNNSTRTDDLRKKIDNSQTYAEHVYGVMNSNNYIEAINKLRNSIINIDMMIIRDLSDLFMNIY